MRPEYVDSNTSARKRMEAESMKPYSRSNSSSGSIEDKGKDLEKMLPLKKRSYVVDTSIH